MQVISKFEQPNSPSSSLTSPSPSSPLSPKYLKDLIEEITKVLENGQESAHHIKSLVDERLRLKIDDHQADLDHHFGVTLNSYEIALSLLKSCDFDQENFMRKRKINGLNNIIECPDLCKSEEIGGRILSKEKRGCYKRRRTGQSWSVEATNLVDDGHAWRKYGQKDILNTKFPRNYYRCTHKHDQKCQATKQVQQISGNPTKYNIIYHGNHTCKNLHKTPSITIDCQEEKSFIYLSFDTNNSPTDKQHKHALNASLFPSSAFHTSPAMLKQDYTSIKEESSSPSPMPHDLDHHHHHYDHHAEPSHNLQLPCSSCSDNQLPCSSDLTSTPVSDQGDAISPHEIYSSAPNLFDMLDADDLINLINLDHCDRLDGMFQNLYQQQDHQT